jgi:hypothetical protein
MAADEKKETRDPEPIASDELPDEEVTYENSAERGQLIQDHTEAVLAEAEIALKTFLHEHAEILSPQYTALLEDGFEQRTGVQVELTFSDDGVLRQAAMTVPVYTRVVLDIEHREVPNNAAEA